MAFPDQESGAPTAHRVVVLLEIFFMGTEIEFFSTQIVGFETTYRSRSNCKTFHHNDALCVK